ncbi:MAG: zinc ribbon domain-containing protein [Clostridia bacterium]|nr:zinc ribbon domain-containing protein [Clostridia bacterium]
MKKCLQCGTEYDGNFCPQCGAANQQGIHCPNCGALIGENAEFCANCGKKLHTAPVEEVKIDPSTEKLLHKLYFVPSLLFILFAVLLQIFYSMEVAKNAFVSKYGDSNLVMNVSWICQTDEYDSSMPLVFATVAIALAAALAVLLILKPLRSKSVTVMGKKHSLGSVISLLLPIAYLPYLIIGISLNSFVKDWEMLGYKAGPAAPLIIVFSILFMLITAVLAIFLFLCERGACGKRWYTCFYIRLSPEQLAAQKQYKKISKMMTYARFPWLRAFAFLQLFCGIAWLITSLFIIEINAYPSMLWNGQGIFFSYWEWMYNGTAISILSYILNEFLYISAFDILFPNLNYTLSMGNRMLRVESFWQFTLLSFFILWVLKKLSVKATHFAPQSQPQSKKHKGIFALLCLWNIVGYYNAFCDATIFYHTGDFIEGIAEYFTRTFKDPETYLPLFICGILFVIIPIFIGKRIFRKANAYHVTLTEYFYGKDAAPDAEPRLTLEDLERAAKGEVIATTESKDQAQ